MYFRFWAAAVGKTTSEAAPFNQLRVQWKLLIIGGYKYLSC